MQKIFKKSSDRVQKITISKKKTPSPKHGALQSFTAQSHVSTHSTKDCATFSKVPKIRIVKVLGKFWGLEKYIKKKKKTLEG